jgi:hypothetical protein
VVESDSHSHDEDHAAVNIAAVALSAGHCARVCALAQRASHGTTTFGADGSSVTRIRYDVEGLPHPLVEIGFSAPTGSDGSSRYTVACRDPARGQVLNSLELEHLPGQRVQLDVRSGTGEFVTLGYRPTSADGLLWVAEHRWGSGFTSHVTGWRQARATVTKSWYQQQRR